MSRYKHTTEYKRETRNKQNVYECCPPPPVELQCSVCLTAENEGSNLWNCVPFLSYTTLFGPNLANIIVHIFNLLPLSLTSWLGTAHQKCCIVRPPAPICEPKVKKPEGSRYCDLSRKHKGEEQVSKTMYESTKSGGDKKEDTLSTWLHDEYISLARELSELKRLTADDDVVDQDNYILIQSRNFVLDRLAEMLAKREEIEKRKKEKKQASKN